MGAQTIYSTTGTAPLEFATGRHGEVFIRAEDGSQQVYSLAELRAAIEKVGA